MEQFRNLLEVEYDDTNRIVYLTASETISISCETEMIQLCSTIRETLDQYGPERLYLVMDLLRFAIEPSLAELYAERVRSLTEDYLYPDGLARYGYQITRVTIMLGAENKKATKDLFFTNKEEACQYIYNRIALRTSHHPLEQNEEEQTTPDTGGIDISQITYGHME
ncbi:MAG TPA: hypothetical protein PLF13_09900 [candidate division Zixibacteria bacterium]|nr:hypothetical protein [candidate division Zixibacteria bacterium]